MKGFVIIVLVILFLFSFFSFTLAQKDIMLIKVFLPSAEKVKEFRELDLALATHRITDHAKCFVIPEELKLLEEKGFEFEVLVPSEKMREYLFGEDGIIDSEYHTYQETVIELDSLADLFPDITRLDSIGQSTQFGYTIWCLKISDNPDQDEDEPNIMFNGMHHGDEPMGNEVCLGLIKYLLNNYGSDPQVTNWVDNIQIYIIPIVNPEGYVITVDESLYWRKNCRDNDENGIFDDEDGVDLNRNYDFYWEWGGSGMPYAPTYRGPYPFSEFESQALRDLGLEKRFVFSISYHTFGAEVLYPWSLWREPPDTFYYENAPDDPVLTAIATEMGSRIKKQFGGTYDVYRLTAHCGYSHNWFYGVGGTYEFIIELCDNELIPPGEQIQGIVEDNLPGPFYLLDRLSGAGLIGRVTDAQTSLPLSAEVEILEATSPVLTPRTSNPEYGSYFRILEPGNYTMRVGKDGYRCEFRNVAVSPDTLTTQDFQLYPNQSPSQFSLLSPADEDTLRFPISFEWQASTDPDPGEEVIYDILISLSPSFHFDSIITVYNIEQTQCSLDSLILMGFYQYSWKVRAHDDFCGNRWSEESFSFLAFNCGDVNADGTYNLSDVIWLAKYYLKGGPPPIPTLAGDVNWNGQINLSDVIYLATYLLKGGPEPCSQ